MSVLTRYQIEQKNPNMLPRRILRSNTVNNAQFPKNNDLFKVVENKKLDFELLEYNLKDMESNLCKLMDNTDTNDLSLINDMYYYGMLPRSQASVAKGMLESNFVVGVLLIIINMPTFNLKNSRQKQNPGTIFICK